ncbi:MAG: Oxidoreductase, zinc-binding dehydrogenase family, partial [Ramlibacter sp.]|nr:Oxidoreductase, zinc-binding dehydrogenase family [Ramlibacter sp.]
GINPGDLKKRENAFGFGMSYPRVIPHSDGAGVIDQVGDGVPGERIGQRVWCFGAQSYRAFGTAAEFTVVPARQAVALPDNVSFEAGACLGIPALTAYCAVHAGGPVVGRHVLVQGGAGGVGSFAAGFARRAGARVIAAVRSPAAAEAARNAGAHHVVRTEGSSPAEVVAAVLQVVPAGVEHVVEVAFGANIDIDLQVLARGGSIAAYATDDARPSIPFWELLFKNARILLQGSDDFPIEDKLAAAAAANDMMSEGWAGLRIDRTLALEDIVTAHEYAAAGPQGRVVLSV